MKELNELWENFLTQKKPEIKEKLILHYIPLVQKIANKMAYYLPNHIGSDDLYGYGVFGLFEAIDRFNPEYGCSFNSFAALRIKGSIMDGMRKEDWVPASIRKKAKLIEKAYQKLEMGLGRNANDEEIAAELGLTPAELSQWLSNIQFVTILSLEEPLTGEEDLVLRDSIPNKESPDPLQLSEKSELKALLAKAVGELPEKERMVISLFYYNDLANKEIAKVMELSDSRVSQLHTKAIFRLRGKLSRVKKNQLL